MNNSTTNEDALAGASREEITSALFANMIMQQTNMALMLMGRTPHPETGETMRDIEGAQVFIDQLEMLEVKTQGNLDKNEEKLLKQSLTALRMAFVEAIDSQALESEAKPPSPSAGAAEAPEPAATATDQPASEEESRKKFSKKY